MFKYFTLFLTYIKDCCRYNADVIILNVAYLLQLNKLNIFLNFDEIELRSVTEVFSSLLSLLKQNINHNFVQRVQCDTFSQKL